MPKDIGLATSLSRTQWCTKNTEKQTQLRLKNLGRGFWCAAANKP